MSRSIRILSTKKLKPNQKQFLLNAGFSVVEADFIRTTQLPFLLQDINENLIFTSQNAVKAVSGHPEVQEIRRNPVFCVGEKTADLLDEVGFTVIESAGNASELAELIVRNYATENFTFFSGNIRRNELPEALQSANIEMNEIEVYETDLTPMKIESEVDGILFFSPSAVEGFSRENELAAEAYFCIGHTTASKIKDCLTTNKDNLVYNRDALASDINQIIVANQPTIESTIAKAINFYNQKI